MRWLITGGAGFVASHLTELLLEAGDEVFALDDLSTGSARNVAGFRPSIGRVPNPKAAFAWSTLSTSGCLGRSAGDLAFALSTIAGPSWPTRSGPPPSG